MGWAAVEGDSGQLGSDMETLLTHLHFNSDMHPRFVAALRVDQWLGVVQGWLPSGVEPNGQQLASAMLVWSASQAACKHVMGIHPAPQEEVTGDQVTASKSLLDEGLPPYVDSCQRGAPTA
eukprot:5961846-Amphidinium_carterae.1